MDEESHGIKRKSDQKRLRCLKWVYVNDEGDEVQPTEQTSQDSDETQDDWAPPSTSKYKLSNIRKRKAKKITPSVMNLRNNKSYRPFIKEKYLKTDWQLDD